MPLSSTIFYKNQEKNFSHYKTLIHDSFLQKTSNSNQDLTDYFKAIKKFILGEELSRADRDSIGLLPGLLADPYNPMYEWLIKRGYISSQTSHRENRKLVPDYYSSAELHLCKLFMRMTYLDLAVDYMKENSISESDVQGGMISREILDKMTTMLEEQSSPRVYRQLDAIDSKKNHSYFFFAFALLMVGTQILGFNTSEEMRERQIQFLEGVKNLNADEFLRACSRLLKPEPKSDAEDYQQFFMIFTCLFFYTIASYSLAVLPSSNDNSIANKILIFFSEPQQSVDPLKEQLENLKGSIVDLNKQFEVEFQGW
jgi:hypothetical protein